MMRTDRLLIAFFLLSITPVFAGKSPGRTLVNTTTQQKTSSADCDPPTAQTDLDVNNVRTRLMNGGDMWWDLNVERYEIPKNSNKHSMFAGSLWIGGFDSGKQLKVAAQTYRQNGTDFWPGPLSANGSTDQATCKEWDTHFKINRSVVEQFVEDYNNSPGTSIPDVIANWPAHGNTANGEDYYMAPFTDVDGNGSYDPSAGDYPGFDIDGTQGCDAGLFGDQAIWWVFNDRGNIHTETGAEPIGLEIHAQAFGFATNDEINNMTFYRYKIINRSSFRLDSTYFGQWADPDLGNRLDDYVGCDVGRGLGYCYNGDADDDGAKGYGENPPAIGIDFFQGPKADPNDGEDNDLDGVIDEPGEEIIMSRFVYYSNNFSQLGEPQQATHYYNYLSGSWKDGQRFTYGGNAYNTGGPVTRYMFPGDSDPLFYGTGGIPATPANWDEVSAGNTPDDRRFLQSAGPFTLAPGAVNYITTGVVWARASQGGPQGSVALLRSVDDKAQALFDNCFRILNGPDAPDMTIQEMDKKLIVYLDQRPSSNNYLEAYEEKDPLITGYPDDAYKFQGHQVYQIKAPWVTVSDIDNPDLARLAFQCDIRDGVSQIVNFDFDPDINAIVPKEMVHGNDDGIRHSFEIRKDLFATGNDRLVNHKPYYYTVIAYAYNNFKRYDQTDPFSLDGQKQPYKAGRRNVKTYTGIPHFPQPEKDGTVVLSDYGSGPNITRLEGQGNGGQILELTSETVNEILTATDHRAITPTYQGGKGPVNIKVIDPLQIPKGNFRIGFTGTTKKSDWWMINEAFPGDTVYSHHDISIANEQILAGKFGKNKDGKSYNWGMSVTIVQVVQPGDQPANGNGFLEATLTFSDPQKPWLTGIGDNDGSLTNWIRSGTVAGSDFVGTDDNQVYEGVIDGTWSPYRLTADDANMPAWPNYRTMASLNKLASVDVVITADITRWSRCPVLEMSDDAALAEGQVKKFRPRAGASMGKDGNVDGSGTGMSWFPGYAINVETGERLNMAFGEDSWLKGSNGNDMRWNPTSTIFLAPSINPVFGGKHFIYVFGHNGNGINDVPAYDEGAFLYKKLSAGSDVDVRDVMKDAMWVSIPLLQPSQSLLACDAKVRLRVAKPYASKYGVDGAVSPENQNLPYYRFSTEDLFTETSSLPAAKDAMALVNVVPNPYYAYSEYEQNQIDTRIKVTNVPEKCTISIYTVNGTLVKKMKKDNPQTWMEWDLKNQAGIPIASGIYIIHVDAGEIGQKSLKWFGVMRPIDLDTF